MRDKSNNEITDCITEMKFSCMLDIVDNYREMTLEQIGELLNLTRERVRQIEEKAIKRVLKPTKERAPILTDLKDIWKLANR